MIKHNGIIGDNSNEMRPETTRNSFYWATITSVINTIAQILEDILKENVDNEVNDVMSLESMQSFYVKKPPSKPVNEYLQRIIKYTKPEPSSVIISLVYIDKLCEMTNVTLSSNNIHRLILTSFVIAVKFNEDDYYSNTYYAKVGGIPLQELNKLEYEMLYALEFNTFVDEMTYSKYESQLIQSDET